ncbi:F-box/kelch-repeat protein At5g43190-like [Selaginella moellendorffii]|uniref:F-box/kelch-repeat protein At5g43190-like n=1 Tax=Selaginella moellendorffii TaxID=88036 RepID=UPI000D1CADE5|nr:F-box/kelch-repeat protein At5g43190-like [Selaginella moellendorffii]|eukprot:XP_024535149.1 F-box/kelch-repeat protein At5g43190-like [Selaginella moellendorffii]
MSSSSSDRWRRITHFDPRIWSSLPHDLLLRIFACLPIKSLLRLRCVSKEWNKALTSLNFAGLQSRVASPSSRLPWILMFKCHSYSAARVLRAFDRSSNKWFAISLSFLPPYATDIAASSGGLLCFKTIHPGQFIVCNPLLSSWRDLPPLKASNMARAAVITLLATKSSTSNTFKVVVAGSRVLDDLSSCERVTEVFDSAAGSWRRIQAPGMAFNFRSETACCGEETIHFTTSSDPPLLFSLNLEQSKWTKSEAPLPESLTYCIPVASERGVLHLVGGHGQHGITKKMRIWKLGNNPKRWTEVDTMPGEICAKFVSTCFHNYDQISSTAQQDLICFSCLTCPQAAVYCIPRNSWMWLPRCEQVSLRSNSSHKWFSLEPNLKQLHL